MPAATRKGDYNTGHKCFPPAPAAEASDDVYFNSTAAHRKGDKWTPHKCGGSPHEGKSDSGSSTVFVNGKAAVRIGDTVLCEGYSPKGYSAEGSDDVFIG